MSACEWIGKAAGLAYRVAREPDFRAQQWGYRNACSHQRLNSRVAKSTLGTNWRARENWNEPDTGVVDLVDTETSLGRGKKHKVKTRTKKGR